MPIKIFRPGGNKRKHSVPVNSQTTSTGITIPTRTSPGNTTTMTGPWVNVPVSKGYLNNSGHLPVIDLDIDVVDDRDGLTCKRCKEFYPYSISNQDDGTLICWSCKNYK